MKHRFASILLGALTCLMLIAAGTGEVCASFFVTNTAGLSFSDDRNHTYTPVQDTAAIFVMSAPAIAMEKDVKNIRTGETSTDIVTAIVGDTIEFIIRFTNTGDTDAFAVAMCDSIPVGTAYIAGSATDTNSLDTASLPDTITFQHVAGGAFDTNDVNPVTAIKWEWSIIEGNYGTNESTVKFRVRVE